MFVGSILLVISPRAISGLSFNFFADLIYYWVGPFPQGQSGLFVAKSVDEFQNSPLVSP